jgi:hypothetical protein
MAALWIAPLETGMSVPPDLVTQLLRRHQTPGDRIEHLRVRAGPEGLLIFGFLLADSSQAAKSALQDLVHRTLTTEPTLRLWRVI